MNQPDRISQWVVEEGEKPMEVLDDAKLPGSILIKLRAQDHTIGNLLRSQLLLDPCVLFAGYRIPHPLTNLVEIRVQTDPNMGITPRKAFLNACTTVANQIRDLKQQFVSQAQDMEMAAEQGQNLGGMGVGQGAVGGGMDAYGDGYMQGNVGGGQQDDPYSY